MSNKHRKRGTPDAHTSGTVREDAVCQQQISRLPVWRPGDFVIVGGTVARVECLTCWVGPGDEVGIWMVSFDQGDPMLMPVIERRATPEEVAASGPWEPQSDYSFFKAQITMTLQRMAAQGELFYANGAWFAEKGDYLAALRAEIERVEGPSLNRSAEDSRWQRLEIAKQ